MTKQDQYAYTVGKWILIAILVAIALPIILVVLKWVGIVLLCLLAVWIIIKIVQFNYRFNVWLFKLKNNE